MLRSALRVAAVPFHRPVLVPAWRGFANLVTEEAGATDNRNPPSPVLVDEASVLPALIRAQQVIGRRFDFPRVVVIGNQSSGKSSVLEAIVGEEFIPKGTGIVTRRPLELTLLHTPSGKWAQFDDGRKIFDFDDVRERIAEESRDIDFSEDPVRLVIHSPDVHNVTLVDLPGYIHAIRAGQSKDLPDQIRDLARKYIDDENNVVLAVVSAAEDVAMSMAVREVNRGTIAQRTMGVLTKMDMRKYLNDAVLTLRNSEYPLGLGYIGVRCRTPKELVDGVTYAELIDREEAWLNDSGLRRHEDLKLGIPLLRRQLSTELLYALSDAFPAILHHLEAEISNAKRDEDFLVAIAKEKDLSRVAHELERLVTQFHPNAPQRSRFEHKLRERIGGLVKQHWDAAVSWNFDLPMLEEMSRGSISEVAFHDQRARKAASKLLTQLNYTKHDPDRLQVDDFNHLLVFGPAGSPNRVDDLVLRDMQRRMQTSAAMVSWFGIRMGDDVAERRADWMEGLTNAVNDVLRDDGMVDQCRDAALDELFQFVDEAAGRKSKGKEAEMARFFFRYLLGNVAKRADEEGLDATIKSAIRREKRAWADYHDFMSCVARRLIIAGNAPKFSGVFSSTLDVSESASWPLQIHAYGGTWTRAYFDLVTRRCGDDVFRLLAVELLSPMIVECIQYSLHLFKSGKVYREAGRQVKQIKQLESLHSTLTDAAAGMERIKAARMEHRRTHPPPPTSHDDGEASTS